jgi:hypothetical protein
MHRTLRGVLTVCLLSGVAFAQQDETAKAQAFKWGADLRIREEAFDEIPFLADPPGVTRGGENNYFRIRSRLWGSASLESLTLFGRFTSEFRHYLEPDTPSAWDWPDEIIVDQLYIDAKGLLDGPIDIRVGRQDMIYGAGRLILEGNPKDGSRSIYFDAVKVSWHAADDAVIDLIGIYNGPEAELEIGPLDRDITGFDKDNNDLTESGGGVYAMIKSIPNVPSEFYYLFKDESSWKSMTDGDPPVPDRRPGRQTHTVGARLLPTLNDQIGFEFEGAAQFGETDDDRDVSGYLGYGGAIWTLPVAIAKAKPTLTAGLYYLSGDDPDSAGKDEGWNPLWARYPQFSELYIYAFDAEKAGYWSNLLYPSVTASIAFDKLHKLSLSAGVMYAPEENGPGGGNRRGNLFTARYDFPIASGLLAKRDKMFGHLLAEFLDPGDYYRVDNTAYFLRWELVYSF